MLKHLLVSSALAVTALAAPVVSQAADVGVSVSIGEPGFYGQINIGNTRPEVVYAQPMIIERVAAPPPPVYLRVPAGHQKNWKRYCGQYGACGRPVYFVRDNWYSNVYAPQYRRDHPHGGPGRGPEYHDDHRGPDHGRGPDRRDDRRDDRKDDHRGDRHDDRRDDRGPDRR